MGCSCSGLYRGENCTLHFCDDGCRNGGLCNRDARVDDELCDCPGEFTGVGCEELIIETPTFTNSVVADDMSATLPIVVPVVVVVLVLGAGLFVFYFRRTRRSGAMHPKSPMDWDGIDESIELSSLGQAAPPGYSSPGYEQAT